MTVDHLTRAAKAELVTVPVRPRERLSELAAMIRFAGSISVEEDELELRLTLADRVIAARCREHLVTLDGVRATEKGEAGRRVVQVVEGAAEVLRRSGLVSRAGTLVVGLPPRIISGLAEDLEAAWRGAFLVAGQLPDPARSSSLEVTCEGDPAGLALVGCARRLGIDAQVRDYRGVPRVCVREARDIGALLSRMGAHRTRLVWDETRRCAREKAGEASRMPGFDDANQKRSASAARRNAARVERAFDILGEDIPDHLLEAGRLRVAYLDDSLEELGRRADPPMTKDAIAGRIRRLLDMADARAAELSIPDTRK